VDEKKFGISRDILDDRLKKEGIVCRKYFYPLTTDFQCYSHKYDSSKTPVAQKIAQSVLTLPIYSELECETVSKICSIIHKQKL
jgi:dTDP-4-amino-4,6-dideoxygalactose transaminase